jgi:hypothetical protein
MFKKLKRKVKKMFREFLVYHNSSLEFRAKILTLMVASNGEISECEHRKLQSISKIIYHDNEERAALLIDTIYEYHSKITTNNGLDFEHLIQLVAKEVKTVKRFASKIDLGLLQLLKECTKEEEERLFQERILEFLENLKSKQKEL